jgi:deazaflavin-dependent oxidoreductase (nitroreductase family)
VAGQEASFRDKIQLAISRSPLRKPLNMIHVFAYRMSGGKLGRNYRALPVLLLTTKGRKSGKERTWPVAHIMDAGNYIVTGSNAGKAKHPSWYLNLKSNPQAKIQVGPRVMQVRAEQANPEEKKRLWQILVTKEPHYGEYQEDLDRQIPMMILRPAGDGTKSRA